MTLFERIFVDQLRHRPKSNGDTKPPDWRGKERVLIAFLEAHHVHIHNVAGEPFAEFVKWREVSDCEADEVATVRISLEVFTKFLVEEFDR